MDPLMMTECDPVDISESDVMDAMKAMKGYIDITPADFREVYRVAYALARRRMLHSVRADDVMTRGVHVIPWEAPLAAAAGLLAQKGISGAPVVDGQGRVVGVVSEKDFLRKMGAGTTGNFMRVIFQCLTVKGCLAASMKAATARDIMSSPAVTAGPDISISDISALFVEKRINRLPIVDADGKPIGIVTRTDLVSSYCTLG